MEQGFGLTAENVRNNGAEVWVDSRKCRVKLGLPQCILLVQVSTYVYANP